MIIEDKNDDKIFYENLNKLKNTFLFCSIKNKIVNIWRPGWWCSRVDGGRRKGFWNGMGKREKQKQKHDRSQRGRDYYLQDNNEDDTSTMLSPSHNEDEDEIEDAADSDADNNDNNDQHPSHDMPSKFLLYQQSVQVSINYLIKCL